MIIIMVVIGQYYVWYKVTPMDSNSAMNTNRAPPYISIINRKQLDIEIDHNIVVLCYGQSVIVLKH